MSTKPTPKIIDQARSLPEADECEPAAPQALNRKVAERLREAAHLLEGGANPFRVAAYYRAADTLLGLREDIAAILERNGVSGLNALPGIGPSLASAIAQMVETGRWVQLDRLRRSIPPERLFQTIAGIGPVLARRSATTRGAHELTSINTAA